MACLIIALGLVYYTQMGLPGVGGGAGGGGSGGGAKVTGGGRKLRSTEYVD